MSVNCALCSSTDSKKIVKTNAMYGLEAIVLTLASL